MAGCCVVLLGLIFGTAIIAVVAGIWGVIELLLYISSSLGTMAIISENKVSIKDMGNIRIWFSFVPVLKRWVLCECLHACGWKKQLAVISDICVKVSAPLVIYRYISIPENNTVLTMLMYMFIASFLVRWISDIFLSSDIADEYKIRKSGCIAVSACGMFPFLLLYAGGKIAEEKIRKRKQGK